MSIGVPIKILHEAEGHTVTLETATGEVYRGKLIEAEDNMNCHLSEITVTHRDGRVAQLENVYIRGSKIRFMILPDMLKNAPMFKTMFQKGPRGGGMVGGVGGPGGPRGGRGFPSARRGGRGRGFGGPRGGGGFRGGR